MLGWFYQENRQKQKREEREQKMLKQITSELGRHREVVYGIAKTVESTKNAIDMLGQSLKVFDSKERLNEEQSYVTHVQLKEICESFQRCLACFQDSMVCQSETLKTTFSTLNKTVLEAFDLIRSENNRDDCNTEQNDTSEKNKSNEISSNSLQDNDLTDIDKDKVAQVDKDRQQFYEEIIKLKIEIDEQLQKNEQLKENIKQLDTNINSINEVKCSLENQITELQLEKEQLNDRIKQLDINIKIINEERCSLEKEMSQTQQEIEQLKQERKRLNIEIHQHKTRSNQEIEKLKQGNDSLITEKVKQMEKKQNEIEHLTQEAERLNIEKDQQISHAQREIELLKQQNECLKIEKDKQVTQKRQELEQFKLSYEHLSVQNEQTIEQKRQENEHLMQEINRLNAEKDQQSNIFAEFSTKHIESEKVVVEMNDKINKLQSECEILRIENLRICQHEGNKEQVQIHFEGKGELMLNIVDELKSTLVQHMGILRRELKIVYCPSVNDVDPEIPLMVLCINVSRIGTDVQRTLHHLKASNRVALLILHHKDVHALPSQASERVLTGVDLQSLGGIFDLAFLADKGLYQCDMNRNAAERIIDFIKTR